jgi:hypothetical protein
MYFRCPLFVTPAKAGGPESHRGGSWLPAFAGMTRLIGSGATE